MDARKTSALRWILAFLFGCLVAGAASTTVGGARSRDMRFQQKNTRSSLQRIDAALEKYRAQNGRYPQNLSELKPNWNDEKDGWRRDWIYSLPNGKHLIESLGLDGERGGIGMDADLSNIEPRPRSARMSLWMRAFDADARMTVISALVCGLIASVLMLAALEKATFAAREWLILVPTLLMAFAVAAVGAAFITMLHIPSGGH